MNFRKTQAPDRSAAGPLQQCRVVDHSRHTFNWQDCNCLRCELPLEAQAKSSGALGTPDRNHDCPECDGSGRAAREVATGIWQLEPEPCARCSGSGELDSKGEPVKAAAR